MCPVCNANEESVMHILVQCPLAHQCWGSVLISIQVIATDSFSDWMDQVFQQTSQFRRAEILTLCWALWKARNDLVWRQKQSQVNGITAIAMEYLGSWINAQVCSSIARFRNHNQGDGAATWVNPQEYTFKVTVDAATFAENNVFGVGMVARNHSGELVSARSICFNSATSPEMAEAVAMKEALSWIKKEKWTTVTIESDCLVVVQAVRSQAPMISPFGIIIEDCREAIRELNTIQVLFIKRSANRLPIS